MAHDERFAGDTRYLAEFTDGVDVVCPSCSGLALVVGDRGYWTPLRARVTCTTCGYSLGPPARWLGPAVGQVSKRCGMCGTRCERTVRGTVNDRTIHMVCGTCGFEFDEDPTWMPTPTGPHDPHVGLPLHFQRSVGGGGDPLGVQPGAPRLSPRLRGREAPDARSEPKQLARQQVARVDEVGKAP